MILVWHLYGLQVNKDMLKYCETTNKSLGWYQYMWPLWYISSLVFEEEWLLRSSGFAFMTSRKSAVKSNFIRRTFVSFFMFQSIFKQLVDVRGGWVDRFRNIRILNYYIKPTRLRKESYQYIRVQHEHFTIGHTRSCTNNWKQEICWSNITSFHCARWAGSGKLEWAADRGL